MAYEKLLPDGNSQLNIPLDGNQRVLKNQNHQPDIVYNGAWITGIQTKPLTYQSEQNATTLCIQFEVGGLFTFLGIPGSEFQNLTIDASLIMGNLIAQLQEQIVNCVRAEDIFATTIRFLQNKLLKGTSKNSVVDSVIKKMCLENMTLAKTSEQIGYSQKQLIKIFKKYVGVSPKQYQRIFRFNKSLSILATEQKPNYLDVSFFCHYFDQPHFIHDFRHFSDFSPTQYLNSNREYLHVISLDR